MEESLDEVGKTPLIAVRNDEAWLSAAGGGFFSCPRCGWIGQGESEGGHVVGSLQDASQLGLEEESFQAITRAEFTLAARAVVGIPGLEE